MADAYRRLAEAVLIVHQRRADSNCLCGRLDLGESWATHVADMLAEVGVLRDRPPASDVDLSDPDPRGAFACPALSWCVRPVGHPLPHRDETAEEAARWCQEVDWCVLPAGHPGDYHYPPGPTGTTRGRQTAD